MTDAIKFGAKYLLLDKLGTGGMAEIFRGKLTRDKGFEKLIVIKKLLSHLTQDQEMVAHFIDEARLAALLQHENIACIYDFGKIDDAYFIAMEYLFGKDLHSVMRRSHKEQTTIPPEIALHITSKVCEAMEYAHQLKDLQNNPLNIVHRDLTPHNIFITYEGKVKVLDFGIAKNELQETRTRVGVVKGKIAYMSPEQLAGDTIDHRSDIFSIGILLYEMISGKRMYTGTTAELIGKAIKAEYQDIRELNPNLPSQLYILVEKAITRNVDTRYQSCAEMHAEIEECLTNMSERMNSRALKTLTLQLFEKEYAIEKNIATKVLSQKEGRHDQGGDKTKIFSNDHVVASPIHNKKKLPIRFIIPVAITLLILAGIIGKQFSTSEPVAKEQITKTPAKAPVSQTDQQQQQQQQLIDQLRVKATKAFNNNRLFATQDSAYKYFNEILQLDNNNADAQKGLQQISQRMQAIALMDIEQGNLMEAKSTIEHSIFLFPNNQRAKELLSILEQNVGKKIEQLSMLADDALRANKLTSPPDDCALEYYNKIKTLDESNSLAEAGYVKIADRYAVLADKEFRDLQMHSAKHFVSEGLKIVPDHHRLLRLKKDLNKSVPEVYLKGLKKNIDNIF